MVIIIRGSKREVNKWGRFFKPFNLYFVYYKHYTPDHWKNGEAMDNQKNLIKEKIVDDIRQILHDIRTPLTGIYGLAELLLHEEKTPEKREYLSDILSSAQALLRYCQIANRECVNKKTKKGAQFSAVCPSALKDFIQHIINLEAATVRSKNLTVKLSYDKNLPDRIAIDCSRLGKVLANLFDNAVKFTRIDGCIRWQIKPVKTGGIIFIVCDDGRGMSVKACRDIQAFFAGKKIDELHHVRIGVGLTLIKQLINQLRGKIDCMSRWRQGTTWRVWIPS